MSDTLSDYVARPARSLAEVRAHLEVRLSNKRHEIAYQIRFYDEPVFPRLRAQYREIAALRRRINILDGEIGRNG
jgi:hypothetical protein